METVVTDGDLIQLGFTRADNGALIAPPDADMRLLPTGRFFKLQIVVGENVISAVLAKVALHQEREVAEDEG